jgi:hypothetical protein
MKKDLGDERGMMIPGAIMAAFIIGISMTFFVKSIKFGDTILGQSNFKLEVQNISANLANYMGSMTAENLMTNIENMRASGFNLGTPYDMNNYVWAQTLTQGLTEVVAMEVTLRLFDSENKEITNADLLAIPETELRIEKLRESNKEVHVAIEFNKKGQVQEVEFTRRYLWEI